MAKSVLEAYPDSDVSVTIVWESMLGSDTEAAARESSAIFDDPRVRQFWDPNRRTGITFSRDVFPNMLRDTAASVPDDMPFLQGLKDRANAPAESAPLWDVAFLYEKGATWKDRPPKPDHWTKQVAFFGGRSDGITGLFWRDDFAKPPLESDWFEELTFEMKKLTGKQPTPTTARAKIPTAASLDGETGNPGYMRAQMIVLQVKGMDGASAAGRVERALGAMKGVFRVSLDESTGLAEVFANVDGPVTAERAIEYLALAGYEATEANAEQYNAITTELEEGGAMVIRRESAEDGNTDVRFPDTRAGRIAKASIESFNSGDEQAVIAFNEEYRTAAMLKEHPMSKRLEQYRSLYKDWGTLRVVSVEDKAENAITVIVRPQKGSASLEMNFGIEKQPPYKLESIRISMSFSPQEASSAEMGDSNRARADSRNPPEVTSLASSIEPLREWFNANKDRARFITLLSPT